ncbi:hypothetical protein [Tenacibaculum ascidiaceicola]|uniref:hypothetical protein n=1 Tax=Tenacibaculum ascidiaceicola TaxID=1699411 RepID=UPI0038958167
MQLDQIEILQMKNNLTKQELLNQLPFFYRYAECNLYYNRTSAPMVDSEIHHTNYYMVESLYKSFF